jgi:starch phosphorylase
MRIISNEMDSRVRMANLGIVGSHKVNGVSALHSDLMKKTIFKDFYDKYPEKFTNVTNGITPRRWLRQCNRPLSELISQHIGDEWLTKLDQLEKVETLADDQSFRESFAQIKQQNKQRLADYIKEELDVEVNPESIFDVQIKRIHEYKRQLMAVFHAITLYNRIKANPGGDHTPRTIIFAGKAAPGYTMAKLHIKLINCVAKRINNDPEIGDRLKCVFLSNYSVSLAELMIPATNLSEQISTAGMEASGTGNMKFALNGALTIGTLDGANIEIRERVGEDNIFIFGMTVDEIDELRTSGYDPNAFVDENEELQQLLAQLSNGYFCPDEPDLFQPIINALLNQGDYFMVIADYASYVKKQEEVEEIYRQQDEWNRRAILNVANMGHFSSDRSIRDYAERIWEVSVDK